jgi:voltage-gated potassium channel
VTNPIRGWPRGVVIVCALVVAYYVLPLHGGWWPVGVAAGFIVVAALAPLAVRAATRVMESDQPVHDAVASLLVLVTLLVLGFAVTYYALDTHDAGQVAGLETKTDALYLSMATAATVGYGDVHPAGQAARVVAVIQMVTNLVAIAAIVRLFGEVARRRKEETG